MNSKAILFYRELEDDLWLRRQGKQLSICYIELLKALLRMECEME